MKHGAKVHIPAAAFPDESPPPCGYWEGTLTSTRKGGKGDIGIKYKDEDGVMIFTRPKVEVAGWVV